MAETPSPEAFAAVADWLAVCVACGKEHKERQDRAGHASTWAAQDGHAYRSRVYVAGGSRELIAILRAAADR